MTENAVGPRRQRPDFERTRAIGRRACALSICRNNRYARLGNNRAGLICDLALETSGRRLCKCHGTKAHDNETVQNSIQLFSFLNLLR